MLFLAHVERHVRKHPTKRWQTISAVLLNECETRSTSRWGERTGRSKWRGCWLGLFQKLFVFLTVCSRPKGDYPIDTVHLRGEVLEAHPEGNQAVGRAPDFCMSPYYVCKRHAVESIRHPCGTRAVPFLFAQVRKGASEGGVAVVRTVSSGRDLCQP